ncbi:hypothetical protein EVAR_45293_1 [Eumeta japonica]|uniref:Uncharacterized protein n=1 Tax=Eumeta variegata TaxID=151549 RepID=A0A4C1Y7U5_EUMVA|nr:hypothetical protein EVAR_45293_1 [Eumeta japonica]
MECRRPPPPLGTYYYGGSQLCVSSFFKKGCALSSLKPVGNPGADDKLFQSPTIRGKILYIRRTALVFYEDSTLNFDSGLVFNFSPGPGSQSAPRPVSHSDLD